MIIIFKLRRNFQNKETAQIHKVLLLSHKYKKTKTNKQTTPTENKKTGSFMSNDKHATLVHISLHF